MAKPANDSRPLSPPAHTRCGSPRRPAKQDRRRTLTRERVVAEALTVIAAHGVDALSMRALATRLGVVPAALYRHVRNKEQLHDLVLDGVLAEVDYQIDHSLAWTEQVTDARAPAAHRPREPSRHRRAAQDPRPPRTTLPRPRRGIPRTAARRRPTRTSKPGWPSPCSTTTPSASPSAAPPPSTSNGSRTPRPEANSTRSSGRCRPTASPPWSPSANTSGSTTATNGSPPASTPSSTDSKRSAAARAVNTPTADHIARTHTNADRALSAA